MALDTNPALGEGGSGLHGDKPGSLAYMVRELQGLKTITLVGAAANTNIAVAGIKTTDTIVSAVMFASGVPSDIPVTITSAGNVQSTANSTGNRIVLQYFVKPD